MKKLPSNFTTLVLTLAVGIMSVNIGLCQTAAKSTTRTALTEATIPHPNPDQKTLEMVFVVDTTGSMGGLIDGAKQKIWSIVNDVMQKKDHPSVRIGLVAYRDNGDAYVTQVTTLTDDLDKIYSTLMDFQAGGGGDTPENVRRGLADGVEKAGWAKSSEHTAQILFLVGDAPPHNDYPQETDVLTTTANAVKRNMIINTIQCGGAEDTREVWQSIAQRGEGKYFAIAQDGGVQAITTPFDARLSELASKLGSTYLAYGGGAGAAGERFREDNAKIQASTELKVAKDAPMAAQADRAMNKAINSVAYQNDLLQSIENESVTLSTVKEEDLPDNLKKLSPADRKKEIDKRLDERKQIRSEIVELSKQREAFIKTERVKLGKQDGFDAAVSNALTEQMVRKGIR